MRRRLSSWMLGLAAAIVIAYADACAALSPSERASLAHDQIELGVCAAEAHDAKENDAGAVKAWAVFDDCMVRKGFYEAGAAPAPLKHDAR